MASLLGAGVRLDDGGSFFCDAVFCVDCVGVFDGEAREADDELGLSVLFWKKPRMDFWVDLD